MQYGCGELAIQSKHAFEVESLPPIHKDPFDRILIAQAMVEGITLLTADPVIAQYPGPIQRV
jgi:PIN domain nuclease of toxin-antitoxin system